MAVGVDWMGGYCSSSVVGVGEVGAAERIEGRELGWAVGQEEGLSEGALVGLHVGNRDGGQVGRLVGRMEVGVVVCAAGVRVDG